MHLASFPANGKLTTAHDLATDEADRSVRGKFFLSDSPANARKRFPCVQLGGNNSSSTRIRRSSPHLAVSFGSPWVPDGKFTVGVHQNFSGRIALQTIGPSFPMRVAGVYSRVNQENFPKRCARGGVHACTTPLRREWGRQTQPQGHKMK